MRRRITIGAVLVGLGFVWAFRANAHDRITTTVSWDREIQPIITVRCLTCHSAKASKTMSLATYEAARPWARAIRQQVLTRRMPIWHAARGFGAFENDPSLSPFEIGLIVAWVDGGAPKTVISRPGKQPAPFGPTIEPHIAGLTSSVPEVVVPCSANAPPAGLLTGLRPQLDRGGSVRVTALLPDGRREVLGWFREFDPEFAPVYWLRTSLQLPTGARLVTEVTASASCSLALFVTVGGGL